MAGGLHREPARSISCRLCLDLPATCVAGAHEQSHKKEGREEEDSPNKCLLFFHRLSLTLDKLFTIKPLR